MLWFLFALCWTFASADSVCHVNPPACVMDFLFTNWDKNLCVDIFAQFAAVADNVGIQYLGTKTLYPAQGSQTMKYVSAHFCYPSLPVQDYVTVFMDLDGSTHTILFQWQT